MAEQTPTQPAAAQAANAQGGKSAKQAGGKSAKPTTYEAVLNQTVTLGEGTRKAGTVMAASTSKDTPINKMTPAEGVAPHELEKLSRHTGWFNIRAAEPES